MTTNEDVMLLLELLRTASPETPLVRTEPFFRSRIVIAVLPCSVTVVFVPDDGLIHVRCDDTRLDDESSCVALCDPELVPRLRRCVARRVWLLATAEREQALWLARWRRAS